MCETDQIDSYTSIAEPSKGLYKELGSKFISLAYPVESQNEVKDILVNIKKEYYDARHHCYAYRIGVTGEQWRYNDDGEPSSSAGKPIYGQLLSNEITDVLVVVVRYFGGTKLGIPGLIRSYKLAALDAINNAEKIEKIATKEYIIESSYQDLEIVMKIIKKMDIQIIKQDYGIDCKTTIKIRLNKIKSFESSIPETLNIKTICQSI